MDALDLQAIERAAAAVAAAARPPDAALIDAWRQLHYAAQVASEVGKAWAAARSDDSHSSFTWADDALRGALVPAPRPFRAVLHARDLVVALAGEDGAALAELPLDGLTLPAALREVRALAEPVAGPARQRAVPAPDLPKHALADGATFSRRDAASFASLAALLAGADALLRALAPALPNPSPVQIWPHHFDMAVLAAPARDRSIGVGLAVPDALHASGYWYVSPWAATPPSGGLRMAALPLEAWTAPPPRERAPALARFLRDAVAGAAQQLDV